jgi:hypothetical protein
VTLSGLPEAGDIRINDVGPVMRSAGKEYRLVSPAFLPVGLQMYASAWANRLAPPRAATSARAGGIEAVCKIVTDFLRVS